MPTIKRVLMFFLLMMVFGGGKVLATCSVSVSPTNVVMGGANTSSFRVSNTGESMINWIRIQSPGLTAFSIAQMNANGWYPNGGGDVANFAGGYLEGGIDNSFNLVLAESGETISSMTWEALASTDGGENFESCGSVNIQVDQRITPTINNASLTISSNSVTISWNTNVTAIGVVNYGTSASYGSSKTSASDTTHSVTINDLSPNTTYHYQIQVSSDGGTVSGSDATFTTAAAGVVQTVTSTVTVNTTTTTTNLVTKILTDTVPPRINLITDFSKNFEEPPTVVGKITDSGDVNVGVVSADYSLDGGKNWIPVDYLSDINKKSTDFEFTPMALDDGNYSIKVRARDVTGNIGLSKVFTIVIDRLPPQIGGSLFSLGPMILKPDLNGNIYTIAGLETKVILSAVGGPMNIDLFMDSQKFSLIKNEESGLWSGLIKINKTGNFKLTAESVDGAKNVTERNLSTIITLNPGKIIDENKKTISKTKIKVYTFEKTLNDFVLWDANPYLQQNPQESDENGEYRLILPAGKYFLEIEANGKRKLRSEIFEIENTTPINQNFSMEKSWIINWWPKTVLIELNNIEINNNLKNPLLGKLLPDFDLSYQDNQFSNTLILGKPTIITFISSWEPQTSDQLLELDKLKTENEGINVVAVAVQESKSKIDIFKKNGGYKIPIIADSDGILVAPLDLESLPTHIFLDRKGIIKEVIVGFLNNKNLIERILN